MRKKNIKDLDNIEDFNIDKEEKSPKKLKEEKKSKKKKVITIILLIFVFLCSFIALYFFVIHKEEKITKFVSKVESRVLEEYKDKEFSICYGTIIDCKKVEYTTEGKVDSSQLGEYTLIYHYKINNQEKLMERIVTIYDDVKPEIIIDSELSFCKNGNVGQGKYHATDNYDGDITDKVKLSIEGDKAYLEVDDTSGNKESIEVSALEFTSDPVINLNGESTVYIYVGANYNDKGATASDICDGDISDKITKSGDVNTNSPGTYTITYSVENSDGKKAEISRKVVVQKRVAVPSGSSCGKAGAIYLTFDDGPGAGTEKILNVLKNYDVKATFFVTSSGADSLIQREHNEGHVVALHTASHNYAKIYSSVDAYFNDLNIVSNRVKRITGVESKIIRFPGGSSNTISRNYSRGIMTTLTREVLSRGYRYHDWNVDSNDAANCAKNASSSCVYSYVVNSLSKSRCNMVLMHDIKTYTANAIEDIVKYGKENGYSFEVITMDTPMVTQGVNN